MPHTRRSADPQIHRSIDGELEAALVLLVLAVDDEFEAVIRLPGRKGYFQPDNDPKGNFWFFIQPFYIVFVGLGSFVANQIPWRGRMM